MGRAAGARTLLGRERECVDAAEWAPSDRRPELCRRATRLGTALTDRSSTPQSHVATTIAPRPAARLQSRGTEKGVQLAISEARSSHLLGNCDIVYLAKSLQIVGLPPGTTLATFDDSMAVAVSEADQGSVHVGGELGAGLQNATTDTEKVTELQALVFFQTYERDDRSMRAMVAQGRLDDAVTFATGAGHGQSDFHFYAFDAALQQAITVDGDRFTAAISQDDDRLSPWGVLPVIAIALVVGLATAGLWPRIAEYRP